MEPPAIDRELLQLFIEESRENLSGIESDLIQIEATVPQAESPLVHKVFRAVHSVKGAAGCLSLSSDSRTLRAIKDLSHRLEYLLDLIRDRVLCPSPGITNVLLQGIELLSQLVDRTAAGQEPEDDELLGKLLSRLDGLIVGFGEKESLKSNISGERLAEQPLPISGVTEERLPEEDAKGSSQNSIRVDTNRLSQLLNTIGEVVIVQTYLLQITNQFTGSAAKELRAVLAWLERNTHSLQLQIMGIRKVPVGPAFGIYRRIVRDLALSLDKKAELVILGEEIEIDKGILEKLADPLKHMIRNAVDHGLERPEERLRLGKSETGTIVLNASQDGTNILLDLSDDGGGLDREAILAKARRLGLIGEEVLSDEKTFALIAHPGFSTAEVVSDISGRGVGMDVVKKNIEELRGSLSILSEQGKGTTFRLRIPSTLSTVIVDGLLVKVADCHFILPLAQVEECVEAVFGETERNLFFLRDELLPFLRLRDLFLFPLEGCSEEVVVARASGERVGLVVDRVLGKIQTVYKPLDNALVQADFFSGATIMGNGEIALILDVPRAIRFAGEAELSMLSMREGCGL